MIDLAIGMLDRAIPDRAESKGLLERLHAIFVKDFQFNPKLEFKDSTVQHSRFGKGDVLSKNEDSVFEALKFMLKVAANVFAVLGEGYIELINRSLSKAGHPIIRVRSSRRGVHVSLDDGPEQVDERIAKIEVARQSLTDALAAMDELKERAEDNKRDLEFLTLQIELAEADKANLSGELKTLKEMAALDSEAVRKVLRLPTRVSIWTERVISFGLGFVASVVASLVYEYVVKRVI